MQIDWQYLITTAISIFAALLSIKAISEAKKANVIAKESQKRNELNQYYPPVSFKTFPENNGINFVIKNESPNLEAQAIIERIKFSTHIRIGKLKHEEDYVLQVDKKVSPNDKEIIFCTGLNSFLEKLNTLITAESSEDVKIHIRAWLEYKPVIFTSEVVREMLEATYSHESGTLILISHTS